MRLAGWFRAAFGSSLSFPKIRIKASTLKTKQKENLVIGKNFMESAYQHIL
jgi:hypothetical protein